MEEPHITVSGGGCSITVAPEIDYKALEEESKSFMAKVVLVHDLADHYNKDRSSFLKMLKRNDIELLFVADAISGQQRRCVTLESAQEIKEIMTPAHEVVTVEESLNG